MYLKFKSNQTDKLFSSILKREIFWKMIKRNLKELVKIIWDAYAQHSQKDKFWGLSGSVDNLGRLDHMGRSYFPLLYSNFLLFLKTAIYKKKINVILKFISGSHF